jgi:hypothetical protein
MKVLDKFLGLYALSKVIIVVLGLVCLIQYGIIMTMSEPELMKVTMYDDPKKPAMLEFINYQQTQTLTEGQIEVYVKGLVELLQLDNKKSFIYDMYQLTEGAEGEALLKIKEMGSGGDARTRTKYYGTGFIFDKKNAIGKVQGNLVSGTIEYKKMFFYKSRQEVKNYKLVYVIRMVDEKEEMAALKAIRQGHEKGEAVELPSWLAYRVKVLNFKIKEI